MIVSDTCSDTYVGGVVLEDMMTPDDVFGVVGAVDDALAIDVLNLGSTVDAELTDKIK